MAAETGDADVILLLVVVGAFQIAQYQVLNGIALSWGRSYQSLEEILQNNGEDEDFTVFGRSYERPLPRIDYGAYYQKNRDAGALCIIGRAKLSEDDLKSFRCE